MSWESEALDVERHDLRPFTCGVDDLDQWLKRQAAGAQARRVSRTFVWADDDALVVAYYALSAHLFSRNDLPRSVGHGSPSDVPSVLLGRLALSNALQGQGLGSALVADALSRVVQATTQIAARIVVVDAISEDAAAFYEHLGFVRIPGSMRFVQKMSSVAAALR